jgi:hypothetical protein
MTPADLVARTPSTPSGGVASPSTDMPHPIVPAPASVPAPAAPMTAGTAGSGAGDGPTRTQTLVWNLAIVAAIAAFVVETSRRIALSTHLPQSQFLTVLIERPG